MFSSQPPIKGDFDSSYTTANVSEDASPYDFALFAKLKKKLNDFDSGYLNSALLVQYV
jgi:hypothetical protein